MEYKNNEQNSASESQKAPEQVDNSRRSFAKVGAIVAPIIMTLANRSAWATDTCSQSGFTSFSNANHAVSNVANVKNTNWKTPAAWALAATWPAGCGKATYNPTKLKFTSTLWSNNKDLAAVKTWEATNAKVLASSVISGVSSTSTATLLAALTDPSNQLLAYQIATVLNNAVVVGGVQQTVPSYFLSGQATLAEFTTFYSNCV
jgi:hypothetical protein